MRRLVVVSVLSLAAACSSDAGDTFEFRIDRPSDLAFGCVALVTDDAGVASALAVPLAECSPAFYLPPDAGADADPVAPDGGDPDATVPLPTTVGLAVETTRGAVVVANLNNGDVFDSDPLTPGHNGLTVGRLPVAGDTTPDGCFTVITNQGSCDLSYVDVLAASAPSRTTDLFQTNASVRQLVSATGGTLAAGPGAIVTPPSATTRTTCGERPVGVAYVAYPTCHALAVVDLDTAQVTGTLRFPETGAPVVAGADLTCPVECLELATGAAVGPEADGPEPVSLVMDRDGSRLFVGARGSGTLYIVALDAAGALGAVTEVPLEGASSIERIAVSKDIAMGTNGQSGTHRFAYVITDDRAIHVVDVSAGDPPVECDTQIDPRYLHGFTDVSKLPCFAVGDVTNPPRRPGARGPAIRLPGEAVPYDLGFLEGDLTIDDPETEVVEGTPSPFRLNGTFVVVSARQARDGVNIGVAIYINVDDENYEDVEDAMFPGNVDWTLALPHQVRDGIGDRRHGAANCLDDNFLGTQLQGGVRGLGDPDVADVAITNRDVGIAEDQYQPDQDIPGHISPFIHREVCSFDSNPDPEVVDLINRPVFQTSVHAGAVERQHVFADLSKVLNETWSVVWEGPLAFGTFDSIRPGGILQRDPAELELQLIDASDRFCELGVEERDIVQLTGCGNDADCSFDETCFLHPDTPAGLTGMCLQRSQVDELGPACRQLFLSSRKYLVKPSNGSIAKDRLTLIPKPVVLASTPVDGCASAAQCQALYAYEQGEISDVDGSDQPPDKTYTCAQNAVLGGPARCIATCAGNTDEECPTGSVCQDLVCIEGAFPAQECLASAQLYEVRAGEAFAVVGSQTGYLHHRVLDLASGLCVDDPTASPLQVGRFHAVEPACDPGDGFIPTGPNPCSLEIDEPMAVIASNNAVTVGTRKTRAIRFANLGFRLELVDVVTLHPETARPADAVPPPDPLLVGVLQSTFVLPVVERTAYAFSFVIAGGFAMRADGINASFPNRIRSAPDGSVWIMDVGDAATQLGTRRGQLIKMTKFGFAGNVD